MSARAAWRLEALHFGPIYRYGPGKTDWFAAGLPREGELALLPRIGEAANSAVATCAPHETVDQVRQRLTATGEDLCVVLNERRVVLGLARANDLRADDNTRVDEVMDPGPVTYRPDTLLSEMVEHMQASGGRVNRTLVTSADGVLIGLLRRADAERALHEAHTVRERHAQ